jgi:predicted nucleic acid-binding protein
VYPLRFLSFSKEIPATGEGLRVVVCLGQLIAPNGRMTVNNELENTLKEAVLFKVISRGLLEELREVTKHQRQYSHSPAPQNTNQV